MDLHLTQSVALIESLAPEQLMMTGERSHVGVKKTLVIKCYYFIPERLCDVASALNMERIVA